MWILGLKGLRELKQRRFLSDARQPEVDFFHS